MAEPEDDPAGTGTAPSRRRDLVPSILGGLAAGLLAGLFGVGGGVLLVPVLVLLMHRSQHVAHATSLVAILLAATTGAIRFGLDGAVSVPGTLALAAGAVAGARLGATFLPKLTETRLRRIFAVVLLVIAVRFLLVGTTGEAAAMDAVPDMTALMIAAHVVGGLLVGVTSAVLGVGGGVIMVPLMVMGFGYGQHIAEGTSLAVIIPTALTGAIAHARNGYTDWSAGWRLGFASILGSLVGASVALSLGPTTLGRMFGLMLLIVAVLMLRRRG